MDRSSPAKLNGVLKALGTDAEDETVVAIVFAVAAEAKQMPELRLKGRGDLIGNLGKQKLVIENVPNSWNVDFLAEELVKISPDLDVDSINYNLVLRRNPLCTADGNAARIREPDIQGR